MDNHESALTLTSDVLELWQFAPCILYSQRTVLLIATEEGQYPHEI